MIEGIEIEGIRCFSKLQKVPLRPLTVLVGENSSGKTTFLALHRLAWDIVSGKVGIDFNEDPFQLGSYDQIASRNGGRRGQAEQFSITVHLDQPAQRRPTPRFAGSATISATFSRAIGPRLVTWSIQAAGQSAEASISADDPEEADLKIFGSGNKRLEWRGGIHLVPVPVAGDLQRFAHQRILQWIEPWRLSSGLVSKSEHQTAETLVQAVGALGSLAGPRPIAFAPIRTQPQRTYDPLKETPRPEGSHVPVTLARLSAEGTTAWRDLVQALERFGKASGLFSGIEVRRMGRKESDPFQIQVNASGRPFNLMDVGYGVSQILPIIVDLVRAPAGQTFLLQQPEVHLHPRAQAELGSFLASLVTAQKKRFLVETHSDYLVDRLRMDVRDKRGLKPEQVLILYFERKAGQVEIHPIELDEFGNLKNVPDGYRSFFLQEDRRLLGIA